MLCGVKARTYSSSHKLCRNHPRRPFLIMIVVTYNYGIHRATTSRDVISRGLTYVRTSARIKIVVIGTGCQRHVSSEPAVGMIA